MTVTMTRGRGRGRGMIREVFLKPSIQSLGSGMIYSRSSFEFSKFRILAKVQDPCRSGSKPTYVLQYTKSSNH